MEKPVPLLGPFPQVAGREVWLPATTTTANVHACTQVGGQAAWAFELPSALKLSPLVPVPGMQNLPHSTRADGLGSRHAQNLVCP